MGKSTIGICFLGLFGQGNLGNEGTFQALLHHARRHLRDADVLAICSNPDDTRKRHGIPAVSIATRYSPAPPTESRSGRSLGRLGRAFSALGRELGDWVFAFRTLLGKDLLVVSGSFLTDFSSSRLDWPYDIFRWALAAKLSGCRLLFVSVGAGPIYRSLNRWFVRQALSLADFRSYREVSTVEYLASIGFSRPSDPVYPDLAFSLPEGPVAAASPDRSRRPVVGLGLMNDPGRLRSDRPSAALHASYVETLRGFACWLIQRGYDIRLLVGDFVYDDAVARDFAEAVRLRTRCDVDRIAATSASSVEELLAQLAGTDIVVATRFHNVLLALALNKPVISISFHHKCVSLMNEMGLAEYTQEIGDLDLDGLIARFDRMAQDAEPVKRLIRQRVERSRRLLDEQYERIFGDSGVERARAAPSTPSAGL